MMSVALWVVMPTFRKNIEPLHSIILHVVLYECDIGSVTL
jgi:hypothetical protein